MAVKLTIFAGMISLVLFSCSKLPKPDYSYFPEDNPEAGDSIRFMNESKNAEAFEWDFGDGGISNAGNPIHIYKNAGIFHVKLNAFNEAGSNIFVQPITINEPTILGFVVYDSSQTRLLPGADILVYENEADRDSLLLAPYSGLTDSIGSVVFHNMEPIIYHVWVSKRETDGAWTFKGYTFQLKQNKVNSYIVLCNWTADQAGLTW